MAKKRTTKKKPARRKAAKKKPARAKKPSAPPRQSRPLDERVRQYAADGAELDGETIAGVFALYERLRSKKAVARELGVHFRAVNAILHTDVLRLRATIDAWHEERRARIARVEERAVTELENALEHTATLMSLPAEQYTEKGVAARASVVVRSLAALRLVTDTATKHAAESLPEREAESPAGDQVGREISQEEMVRLAIKHGRLDEIAAEDRELWERRHGPIE
jgi:hypothetical protein